jgi:hypothetical protein
MVSVNLPAHRLMIFVFSFFLVSIHFCAFSEQGVGSLSRKCIGARGVWSRV